LPVALPTELSTRALSSTSSSTSSSSSSSSSTSPVVQMLLKMAVDKKNQRGQKHVVMLSAIGEVLFDSSHQQHVVGSGEKGYTRAVSDEQLGIVRDSVKKHPFETFVFV
jgi:3-dehydroquinate synthetase